MRTNFPLALLLLALLVPAGCKKPDPAAAEQEIERRVQERLAEQRRAEQEQQLKEREQSVSSRERELTERESKVTEREAATAVADEQARQREVIARSTPAPVETESVAASTPSAPGRDDAAYEHFYDDLSPDGEWYEVPQYGYVWRPYVTVTNVTWRPYFDGRWVYTDYGWNWVSNERFGWATYHYGRWTRLSGIGWVWVPGREWAPAWVSWRSDDQYIGWAPLGPMQGYGDGMISVDVASDFGSSYYCFVSSGDFCEGNLAPHILNVGYNQVIIKKTKNITKIVKNVNKKVVYNYGPDVKVVETQTKRQVKQYRIEKDDNGKTTRVDGDVVKVANVEVKDSDAKEARHTGKAKRVTEAKIETTPEIATTTSSTPNQANPQREPKDPSKTADTNRRNERNAAIPQPTPGATVAAAEESGTDAPNEQRQAAQREELRRNRLQHEQAENARRQQEQLARQQEQIRKEQERQKAILERQQQEFQRQQEAQAQAERDRQQRAAQQQQRNQYPNSQPVYQVDTPTAPVVRSNPGYVPQPSRAPQSDDGNNDRQRQQRNNNGNDSNRTRNADSGSDRRDRAAERAAAQASASPSDDDGSQKGKGHRNNN